MCFDCEYCMCNICEESIGDDGSGRGVIYAEILVLIDSRYEVERSAYMYTKFVLCTPNTCERLVKHYYAYNLYADYDRELFLNV
mmetsp:Transcript_4782/g.7277  ORF Transcript_4782/g.7277 Transcript_4782/m.7277 type:complete len:84 (-) Transcript_4782:70-321(-)